MSDNTTPLSYQTTMPEYPDVSKQAWYNSLYGSAGGYMYKQSAVPLYGESYDTWRTNQLDKYNAAMSAYNTWLGTGAGQRASLESGNYNPSYFGGQNAQASGVNYGQTQEGNPFTDMAKGVSGIFSFANALMGVRMMASQIAGQKLKNEAQSINNRFLERMLSLKADNLSYQADKRAFDLETLFYPRWSSHPELWKGGAFSPYGRGTYDLRDANSSFGYQKASADIDYLRAGKQLRDDQAAVLQANKREKDWYYENVLDIQKDILTHSRDILKGTYDFQKTEQNLRKAGVIAGISVNVINAAVNAIKAFIPGAGMLDRMPGWSVLDTRSASPNLGPANGGLDFTGFGSYSPYE